MREFLVFISGLFFSLCPVKTLAQQSLFPEESGMKMKYNAVIEMQKGYLSGICILLREEDEVKGCFFNEFGISALDFTYFPKKDKLQLHRVIAMMNKWYIKRVLKRDLRALFHELQTGNTVYQNPKYKIQYQFTPLQEDEVEK